MSTEGNLKSSLNLSSEIAFPLENNPEYLDFQTFMYKYEDSIFDDIERELNVKDWEAEPYENFEDEECQLDSEIQKLEKAIENEIRIEEAFAQDVMLLKGEYLQKKRIDDEYQSALKQIEDIDAEIEKTSSSNIYMDMFQFDFSGNIATINGFPLGTTQNKPEEWAIVDTGWSHVFLILLFLYRLFHKEKIFHDDKRKTNVIYDDILCIQERKRQNVYTFTFKEDNDRIMPIFLAYLTSHFEVAQHLEVVKKEDLHEINLQTCSFVDKETKMSYSLLRKRHEDLDSWNYAVKLMAQNLKIIMENSFTLLLNKYSWLVQGDSFF